MLQCMSIVVGRPTSNALQMVPDSAILTAGEQQLYQKLLVGAWKLGIAFAEMQLNLRSSLLSVPPSERQKLDDPTLTPAAVSALLRHPIRAAKRRRQRTLEAAGFVQGKKGGSGKQFAQKKSI